MDLDVVVAAIAAGLGIAAAILGIRVYRDREAELRQLGDGAE